MSRRLLVLAFTALITFVASAQTPMPPGGVFVLDGGGTPGNNNPDGYPTSGTTWLNLDYNTQNIAHILDQQFTTETWSATQGRSGSGAWRITITGGGLQDNVGYLMRTGGNMPAFPASGASRRIFVGHTVTMSPAMLTTMLNNGETMKWIDIWQYDANGGGPTDDQDASGGYTRFVSLFGRDPTISPTRHLRFTATPGGAGPFYADDGVHAPVNFETYLTGGFVWLGFVLQEGNSDPETYMRVYYKRCGIDSGVTRVVFRDATVVAHNPPDPDVTFGANGRGWNVGDKTLGGYLNTEAALANGSEWYVVDDQTVSDFWIGPPAGC